MQVAEAVARRRSVRAFTNEPVAPELLREVVEQAARAPSGGNLQPWRIHLLLGAALQRFRGVVAQRLQQHPAPDPPDYLVYPPSLHEPYRTQRFEVGEALYALLGIAREDKPARLLQFGRNYDFFGAPVGLFCFIDRRMGPGQWSDLGMYLQTLMLLLQERGVDSCAQESWSTYHKTVSEFVAAPSEQMLFCGMAIGYADPNAPENRLYSARAPLSTFATFHHQ
ncbi:MAG TPA: nitroreductase [Polyangiales bacterium]|nr:nitroreductase [Polyangiales bacterium]